MPPYRRTALLPETRARTSFRFGIALAFGLLTSCDRPEPTVSQSPGRLPTRGADATVGVPSSVRDEENAFADLARSAPSTAGFYFDAAGRLIIRVRDAADNDVSPFAA